MSTRSTSGRETWRRLLEWDRGQAAAERLAAHILRLEGFTAVDPSHPLGGKDGLKDVVCRRGPEKWIGAAYFPRGQQTTKTSSDKFADDAKGVERNGAIGIVFVTNQELSLSERSNLIDANRSIQVDLHHLERISSLLDSPRCYGIRLEFLDIEMNKEEQLSYMAMRDAAIAGLTDAVDALAAKLAKIPPDKTYSANMPVVTPIDISPFSSGSSRSLSGRKFATCKGCDGVFAVDAWSAMSSSAFTMTMAVTCPYCGRTQSWNGLW